MFVWVTIEAGSGLVLVVGPAAVGVWSEKVVASTPLKTYPIAVLSVAELLEPVQVTLVSVVAPCFL